MDNSTHPRVTETHIQWLQSLTVHLCDAHTISSAFQISPEQLAKAIDAIKRALKAPNIAYAPMLCSSVSGGKGINYLQRILPVAHDPDLWIKSGFNRAQLRAILDAFEDARESLAERLDETRIKKVEAIRKNEYTRTVTLHKAQKRFR